MNIFDMLIRRKIPDEVFQFKKKILHLSDTPDVTFSYIKRLIRIVQPDIIIHTGDLVDNIKLELTRNEISIYDKRINTLFKILRSTGAEKIIFCLGNHDDETIIRKYLSQNEFLYKKAVLDIGNRKICMSHKYEMCDGENADYYLFGHSPDMPSRLIDKPFYLNGIDSIYIIDALTGELATIPYPKDTDYFRQKKFKLGF